MSDRPKPEAAPLITAVLESFAQAGRSYLRLSDAKGETIHRSHAPSSAKGTLRAVSVELDDGPGLVLEGELDDERLSAIALLLEQTLSLHNELAETRTSLGRTREELALLFELSQTLSRVTSVEDVVDRFLADVVNVLDAKEGTFLALDEERQELQILCHHGSTPRTVAEFRLAVGEGVAGRVAESGEAMIINNTADCDFYVEAGNPISSLIAVPMRIAKRIVGVVSINDRKGGEPFTLGHLHLLSSLARLGEVGLENARLYEEVRGLLFDVVDALIGVMEARDPHTVGHSRRVARLSYSLGRQMRLRILDLERLYLAALVHDIGKVSLPPELLRRQGSLTEYEEEMVRKHPEIGAGIIRSVRRLSESLPGLVEHHERWDGKGYPSGLAGEKISLQGRIIAVANCFDAMTNARAAEQAMRPEEALAEVQERAGTELDPDVVKAFGHVYRVLRLEVSVPPEKDDEPWDSSGGAFTD